VWHGGGIGQGGARTASFDNHAETDFFLGVAEGGWFFEEVDVANQPVERVAFPYWRFGLGIERTIFQGSEDVVQFVGMANLSCAYIVAIVGIAVFVRYQTSFAGGTHTSVGGSKCRKTR